MCKLLFLAAAIAYSCVTHAKVTVEYTKSHKLLAIVKVKGEIKYDDEVEFEKVLENVYQRGYKLKLNAVVLNTKGGNVYAAQAMGRIIRERKLNTYVPATATCASACIYLLSGGLVRMAYGTVKVHRAIHTQEIPFDKLEKEYKTSEQRTKDYISEMGLSFLLAEAINSTPYWATRELENIDKMRWGVHGTERLYEETWYRKSARERGISMQVVYDYFDKHFAECSRRAKQFEITVWDCIYSKLP